MRNTLPIFALLLPTPALLATVLTFENTTGTGFGNGCCVPVAYGDRVASTVDAIGSYLQGNGYTPNIRVSQGRFEMSGIWSSEQLLQSFDANYGDLTNVAYTGGLVTGAVGLKFEADPGWLVRINQVDFAGWNRQDRPIRLQVFDELGAPVADSGLVVAPGKGFGTFSPNVSGSILYLVALNGVSGSDFNNGGIDNVNFDQVAQVAVPEPTAIVTAGLGLLIFGRAGQRRSKPKAK
ncbi:MAG: hypothetical protein SFV18_04575 [Bryobacteraceae bacterium]|nr:hypothetical protein [Bryobacteraceae bacterium]